MYIRMLTGLGNGILTSSVYIVEVVAASRRGSVVMVRINQQFSCKQHSYVYKYVLVLH